MSSSYAPNCGTTLSTLEQRLELFNVEIVQKLNDLIRMEEVNQLWKVEMESTMHCLWAKVCTQRVSVSVSCQTDEQLKAHHVISRESSSHFNGTGPSLSETENCFESIFEEDGESNNRGHTDIEIVQVSSSSVHENTWSTSVVSAAPQQRHANEPRSEEKRSHPCIDCKAKFSSNVGQNPSQEKSCLLFNDVDEENDEEEEKEKSYLLFNDEEDQQNPSRAFVDKQASLVVIPTGSSSANHNKFPTSVVPDTPQEEPSNLVNAPRSKQLGSLLSTYCSAMSSQNDTLSKHQQSPSESTKPSFKCQRCLRVFPFASYLARHDAGCRKRIRNLPFECFICERSYETKEQLKKHLIYHRREKHFCPVCGKAFTSTSDMNRHMVIHTGEYTIRCLFCEKRYTSPGGLSYHVRTKHQQQQL